MDQYETEKQINECKNTKNICIEISNEMDIKLERLQELCNHNKTSIKDELLQFVFSYGFTGDEIENTETCDICGKILNIWSTYENQIA